MIALDLPEPLLWLLRWLLLLGPMAAALWLGAQMRDDRRKLVGGLFSLLYGLGLIFATHQLAIAMGWWRYGGDVLMFMGLPADIWIGGALLFGPVLYYTFPHIGPFWLTLPIIIGLHGLLFTSLKPLVWAGQHWFAGVLLVFLTAHIPAIYLARWTARDEKLALRATLLAIGYGFLAFGVLPSLIMQSLSGSWDLASRPAWLLALCALPLSICMLMGLSAVQSFVVHGEGTPIPLDPTKRLVRTGIFAYVTNPMQLSTAAAWIVMGIALANPWIASAAIMAWIFVQGMVRWHHRNDLLVRFPEGWPIYRANVPEWIPRWKPWIHAPARLSCDPMAGGQARLVRWLEKRNPTGLEIHAEPGCRSISYLTPDEGMHFTGIAAIAKALNHINFAFALGGAAMLLIILPARYVCQAAGAAKVPEAIDG